MPYDAIYYLLLLFLLISAVIGVALIVLVLGALIFGLASTIGGIIAYWRSTNGTMRVIGAIASGCGVILLLATGLFLLFLVYAYAF
jgi:hypothetical protein